MLLNHLPSPLDKMLLKVRAPFIYAERLVKGEIDLHPYKTIEELETKYKSLNCTFTSQIAQELSGLPPFKGDECWECQHLCAIHYPYAAFAVGCGADLTDEEARKVVLRVGKQIKGLDGFREMRECPKRLEADGQPDCVATLRDTKYHPAKSNTRTPCKQSRPLHPEWD